MSVFLVLFMNGVCKPREMLPHLCTQKRPGWGWVAQCTSQDAGEADIILAQWYHGCTWDAFVFACVLVMMVAHAVMCRYHLCIYYMFTYYAIASVYNRISFHLWPNHLSCTCLCTLMLKSSCMGQQGTRMDHGPGHGKNISLDAMLEDQSCTRVDKTIKNDRICGNIFLGGHLPV